MKDGWRGAEGRGLLIREPLFRFDKSVLREAETVELCHRVFSHANMLYENDITSRSICKLVLNKQGHALSVSLSVCIVSSAKKLLLCSVLTDGLISGSLRLAGTLVYAALISGISMRQLCLLKV